MFRSEEMDSHSLSPVFKLVWKVLSQVDGGYPWYDVMKMTLWLCDFPTQSLYESEKWKLFSGVWLFVTPRTIKSMEFSRPEYWSG